MGLLVVQHHNIQLVSYHEALTVSLSISLTKEQVLTDFADILTDLEEWNKSNTSKWMTQSPRWSCLLAEYQVL